MCTKFLVIDIVFGVDVGGSGVKGAPVNIRTGEKLEPRYKIKTPEVLTPTQMVNTIKELLNHFNWEGPVGCGFPVRLEGSTATTCSNLHKDWIGLDLKSLFEGQIKMPFEIVNDADAAGIAEMRFGAGQEVEGLGILCTFGTGIGSAMFHNRQLIPNSELGQLEFKKDKFEKYAADSARKREGLSYDEWGKRVNKYLSHVELLFSPELLVIGGGSSKRLDEYEHRFTFKTPYVAAKMLNVAGTVGAALAYAEKQHL